MKDYPEGTTYKHKFILDLDDGSEYTFWLDDDLNDDEALRQVDSHLIEIGEHDIEVLRSILTSYDQRKQGTHE